GARTHHLGRPVLRLSVAVGRTRRSRGRCRRGSARCSRRRLRTGTCRPSPCEPGAMISRALIVAAAIGLAVFSALAAPAAAPVAAPAGHIERVEHLDPESAPSRGPAHALVTIELFFVPGSNMPVSALRLLEQLQDHHPARIRLIYRILKSGSALLVPSAALEA